MPRFVTRGLPVIESGSLFDPGLVSGLGYWPDYVSAREEAELILRIDRRPWCMALLRRRQWYGWAYDDSPLGIADDYLAQPMPEWLLPLARRLAEDGHLTGMADRVLINEYQPGQGIGAHKDRDSERIKAVAILSLGAGLMMDFTRPGHATRSHYLRRRSLLVMTGEAREQWLHGIVGRKSDRSGGVVIPRGRRLSVTFRHIADETIPQ